MHHVLKNVVHFVVRNAIRPFCSEKCSSEVHLFELNPRCRGVSEVLTSVGWIFAFDNNTYEVN
jgi:hypothetical protein